MILATYVSHLIWFFCIITQYTEKAHGGKSPTGKTPTFLEPIEKKRTPFFVRLWASKRVFPCRAFLLDSTTHWWLCFHQGLCICLFVLIFLKFISHQLKFITLNLIHPCELQFTINGEFIIFVLKKFRGTASQLETIIANSLIK